MRSKHVHCTMIMPLLLIMVLAVWQAGAAMAANNDDMSRDLIRAAGSCRIDEVRNILNQGVDVDSYAWGETALHNAARHGCENVVYLLLQSGAYVDSKNHDGNTPMDLARQSGYPNVVNLLHRYQRVR